MLQGLMQEAAVQTGTINICKAPFSHCQNINIQFLKAGCPSCRPINNVKVMKSYPKQWLEKSKWNYRLDQTDYLKEKQNLNWQKFGVQFQLFSIHPSKMPEKGTNALIHIQLSHTVSIFLFFNNSAKNQFKLLVNKS